MIKKEEERMDNWIQLGISLTLILTFFAVLHQLKIQNRLLLGQALRDQWEIYWKSYELISNDEVEEFKDFVGDYISEEVYNRSYKDNPKLIRQYIYYTRIYEYLAFVACQRRWVISEVELSYTNPLFNKIKIFFVKGDTIPQALDSGCTDEWLNGLIQNQQFLDVHNYIGHLYPDINKKIENLRKEQN